MNKKELRPSAMTVVCYLIAVVLIVVAFFKAVNTYQVSMGGLSSQGLQANDAGVIPMVIGIILDQTMVPFALGVLFYCVGAMNQRIHIQHKELMYKLSLMDLRKTKK